MNDTLNQIEDELHNGDVSGVINFIINDSDFKSLFEQALKKQRIPKESFNRQFFRSKPQLPIIRHSDYRRLLLSCDSVSDTDSLFLIQFFKPLLHQYQVQQAIAYEKEVSEIIQEILKRGDK